MSRPAEQPVISAVRMSPNQPFVLMATSYGQTTPAGPRLFRAPPHPDIRFSNFDTLEEAQKDAGKLQAYIAAAWSDQPRKKKTRA